MDIQSDFVVYAGECYLSSNGGRLSHVLQAAVVAHGHEVLHTGLHGLQRQLGALRRGVRGLSSRLLGLQSMP